MGDSETKAVTGIVGIATENDTAFGVLGTVTKAIEVSSDIPADAKKALKDFVNENFPDLMDHITNIENFPVPENIAEWWPLVVEFLKDAAVSLGLL